MHSCRDISTCENGCHVDNKSYDNIFEMTQFMWQDENIKYKG